MTHQTLRLRQTARMSDSNRMAISAVYFLLLTRTPFTGFNSPRFSSLKKLEGNFTELTFAKTSGIVTRVRGKNWPIADGRVPSNDPRNNCGTLAVHFSFLYIGNSMICNDIWHKYHEWYFKIVIWNLRKFWNITSGIYAKYHVQIMQLFVYTTTRKRFVIFTCTYFKLSWNTTALSQSNCRNFSCSSIKWRIACGLTSHSHSLHCCTQTIVRNAQNFSVSSSRLKNFDLII